MRRVCGTHASTCVGTCSDLVDSCNPTTFDKLQPEPVEDRGQIVGQDHYCNFPRQCRKFRSGGLCTMQKRVAGILEDRELLPKSFRVTFDSEDFKVDASILAKQLRKQCREAVQPRCV